MKCFQVFKPFVFLLYNIGFGDTYIIISECEKILFASKTNQYNWSYKVNMNILVRFYYPWLGDIIILLSGFCFFVVIIDKSFCIINEFNFMEYKVFFHILKFK